MARALQILQRIFAALTFRFDMVSVCAWRCSTAEYGNSAEWIARQYHQAQTLPAPPISAF